MKTKTNTQKKPTSRRRKKTIRNIVVLSLTAAFLGWFASLKLELSSTPDAFDYVIPFEERKLSDYKHASGIVIMSDIEAVSTEVTQKIKKVNFRVGDIVKKGDVLCEFESEALNEQIERMESLVAEQNKAENLENANSSSYAEYIRRTNQINVEKAQMALQKARQEYDDTYAKYSDYFDKCYSTSDPAEADMYFQMFNSYHAQLEPINDKIRAAQRAYNVALEESRSAAAELESSEYEKSLSDTGKSEYEKHLEKLYKERDNLIVVAPKDGIVAESYATEGAYAFDNCLFRIGNTGNYKVEVFVNSKDILDITEGMEASFRTVLTGTDEINAKVTKISDVFNKDKDGYGVELEVTDQEHMDMLRHNVGASSKIYLVNKGSLPAVQYDAVFEDEDGKCYVYKAVKNNEKYIAKKISVEKGYEADFYVEITSSELEPGDLIVGNAEAHKDGDVLKIKGVSE
ncbi:MAG: HlyD family efflux transporter periplasmic adaptor subunit [Ruminococcus sp.]|nr:HlyD family efflux transporter periplasmic adaptor subunit [Ruminococcus sp.]